MMQSERMNNTCDQLEAGEKPRIAWVRVVPAREADKYLADKKIPGKDWTVRMMGSGVRILMGLQCARDKRQEWGQQKCKQG